MLSASALKQACPLVRVHPRSSGALERKANSLLPLHKPASSPPHPWLSWIWSLEKATSASAYLGAR